MQSEEEQAGIVALALTAYEENVLKMAVTQEIADCERDGRTDTPFYRALVRIHEQLAQKSLDDYIALMGQGARS